MTEPAGPIRVLAVGTDQPPPELFADDNFELTMIEPFGPRDALPTELTSGVQVLMTDVAPANVAAMTELRWLQLGSAGYLQLADSGLVTGGVTVTNASGVNDIPIGEWCLLMMMALERDLVGMLADRADRKYRRPARYQSEIRGRRLGIVGIGREVARQATAAKWPGRQRLSAVRCG